MNKMITSPATLDASPIFCRYHAISPFCMGKDRPLRKHEMTLEHLIPKTRMRQAGFRDKYGYKGIGTSSFSNTDITCKRCNHYKKNAADLEFAWKLQYMHKHGIHLKNKEKLRQSLLIVRKLDDGQLAVLPFTAATFLTPDEEKGLLHTIQFGECQIAGTHATLRLGKQQVLLDAGRVISYRKGNKMII